jgi:hypothetical protein
MSENQSAAVAALMAEQKPGFAGRMSFVFNRGLS